MEKTLPAALTRIDHAFSLAGLPVRLVGGAVRDIVMGKQPKDWDMATPALPAHTLEILETIGKPFDLSNGHGTVSIVLDDEMYEITTLRKDVETDGRHAKVEFVSDFQTDAARRDFTFNAMSMDIITREVFDFFGGQDDLARGVVKFVGEPRQRLREDYLRMLRYYRFLGKMNFMETLDMPSLHATFDERDGLKTVSGERVWMEVQQMMLMPQATRDHLVDLMQATGVWDVVVNR